MALKLDLIEFAAEFVETACKCIDEAPGIKKEIFTSRKSQAITSMGIARILREGKPLSIPQIVSLTVVTTPPEAQKYAEMIALRILLDQPDPKSMIFFDEFEDKQIDLTPPKNHKKIPSQLTAQALLLEEILDFLDLNTSIDLNRDMDILNFIESLESDIFRTQMPSPFSSSSFPSSSSSPSSGQNQSNSPNSSQSQPPSQTQNGVQNFSFKDLLQKARKRIAFQLVKKRMFKNSFPH
ncbi:MAG: hypothetical protein ACTSVU_07045 [Promethearchaeota archaeon]